jgi:hypothetical protein
MAILIVFTGESNSGGQALNSELSGADLLAFPSTQILNNTSLMFENLQIGVNNLIGHDGIPANLTHGWERGLARRVKQGSFKSAPVYLVKTGQGGSIISQWVSGEAYYNTFLSRLNAAKSFFQNGGIPYRPVLWYTQSINDAGSQTDVETWKTATIAHFAKIRLELPNVPIFFGDDAIGTVNYSTWTAAIKAVVAVTSNCYFIDTTTNNNNYRDVYHWNAAGMLTSANRLVDRTIQVLGLEARNKFLPQLRPSFLPEIKSG